MDMDPHHHAGLTVLGLGFLTFNSLVAAYRSYGDPATVAFVCGSYAALVLLFVYLRSFEPGAPSSTSNKLKASIWALTTLLTAVFFYKVAVIMPLPLAIMVWAMTCAAAGGFYALFSRSASQR